MSRSTRLVAVAAALTLIGGAGCSADRSLSPADVLALQGPLRIRVDSFSTYPCIDCTPLPIAHVTLLNVSGETLYVPACGGEPTLLLQRLERDEWVDESSGFCNMNVSSAPVPIAPGASRAREHWVPYGGAPRRFAMMYGVAGQNVRIGRVAASLPFEAP